MDSPKPSAFASTQDITNHGRNVAISETHIFSDRTINQISGGYNRIFNHILSFGDRSCEAAKLGIPGANLDSSCSGFPAALLPGCRSRHRLCQLRTDHNQSGRSVLGDWVIAASLPSRAGPTSSSIADSLDMIRGKHNIRVGGQIRAQQMNVLTNAFQDGFFVFTNLWTNNGPASRVAITRPTSSWA